MNEKKTGLPLDAKTEMVDWREQLDETIWNGLTEAEKAELLNLSADVEMIEERLASPPYYVDQRQEDRDRTLLICDLRLKIGRIKELIIGYPQTGSMASVVARQKDGLSPRNLGYRLEHRRSFFINHPGMILEHERVTFGKEAITTDYYEYPQGDPDSQPIALGHLSRADDGKPDDERMLYSYMLIDRTANPNAETLFQRKLPKDSLFLNGIGVRISGEGFAIELMDQLLAYAGAQTVYFSVKASNFSMMKLASRTGEAYRDPTYHEGPHAGRSRVIELLSWDNFFRDSAEGDRVLAMHDPGILFPDSIASLRPDDTISHPNDVRGLINDGCERIVLPNEPTVNSANNTSMRRVENAVHTLLKNGYVGIPLEKHRLFVRIDSLPPRIAHLIRWHYGIVDTIRQEDYALQRASKS